MGNILITGMTAPQTSSKANIRTQSYAGQLAALLLSQRHVVTWQATPLTVAAEDFDQFDMIFIGISPILSLGSNFSYGALKAIHLLMRDPRTVFFIDAPLPSQIHASIRSLAKDNTQLIKPFFKNRPGYDLLASNDWEAVTSVLDALRMLQEEPWPITLYPRLPWEAVEPSGFSNLLGLNLDAVYSPFTGDYKRKRLDYWVADVPTSKWVQKIQRTLTYGVAPMRGTKFAKDTQVKNLMSTMVGSLIVPQRDGTTWWSPRYVQSLSVGTPVVTEWRDTVKLCPDWAHLPSSLEFMDAAERFSVAERQMASYLAAISSNEESIKTISGILPV